MNCIACGGHLVADTRVVQHRYKGVVLEVAQISGEFCADCGEAYYDAASSARLSAAIRQHQEEVTQMQSFDLLRIRRKLKLKQTEAGLLFGGGSTAFSRYETGKVAPPLALIQLFKVLDKHPELLNELR